MSLAQPSHMTEYRKVHSGGASNPIPVSVLTTSLSPNGADITEGEGCPGNTSFPAVILCGWQRAGSRRKACWGLKG